MMKFTKALRKVLIDEVVEVQCRYVDSYTTFCADGLPKVRIKTQVLGPWLWVKSKADYGGATYHPSTDRIGGDPYSAHVFHDWVGLANSAPKVVSQLEDLNDWALTHTEYERQYTDVGVWGVHTGRWIHGVTPDGIVTFRVDSSRSFQDVSPSAETTPDQIDLNRFVEISFDGLIQLLDDENTIIREIAIKQLGELRDPRAVDPYLIQAADDDDWYVQERAIDALGKLGGDKAIEKLISILSEREYQRSGPIKALVRIGEPTLDFLPSIISIEDEKLSLAIVEIMEGIGGNQSLDFLLQAMQEKRPPVRARIIKALGTFTDVRLVDILIKELESEESEVQIEAIRSLGNLQDQRAVDPLVTTLLDNDMNVRDEAARVLISLGWKPTNPEESSWLLYATREWDKLVMMEQLAADVIIRALGDENRIIRESVLESLCIIHCSIKDLRAIEPLLRIYEDEETSRELQVIRRNVLLALGRLGVSEAVQPLIQIYLTIKSEFLRKASYIAFVDLVDSGVDVAGPLTMMISQKRVTKSAHDELEAMLKIFRLVPVNLEQIREITPRLKVIVKSKIKRETTSLASRLLKISELTTGFSDDDFAARKRAAKALGKTELPSATYPLIQALEDVHFVVRKTAVTAMCGLRKGTVSLVLSAFDTKNINVRIGLARVLGHLHTAVAAKPLIIALRDQNPSVRQNAAWALARGGGFLQRKEYQSLRTRIVKSLTKAMTNDEFLPVRFNAIYTLAWMGDSRAVEPLLTALFDPVMEIRLNASYALIRMSKVVRDPNSKRGKQIVDNLILALSDEVDKVRYNAAEALRMYGGTKALEALTATLDDRDEHMRDLAKRGIKEIEELGGKQRSSYSFTACYEVEIADPVDMEELILMLRDKKESVRKTAHEALGNMGQLAFNRCLGILQDKDEHRLYRVGVALALGYIGGKRAVDVLIEALRDEHKDVRCNAAFALAKLKDKRSLKALIKATTDKFWKTRGNAVAALGRIRGLAAFEAILRLLDDEHPKVREVATSYLWLFKSPRVLPALKKQLNDDDASVRKVAKRWYDYLRKKSKSKSKK